MSCSTGFVKLGGAGEIQTHEVSDLQSDALGLSATAPLYLVYPHGLEP